MPLQFAFNQWLRWEAQQVVPSEGVKSCESQSSGVRIAGAAICTDVSFYVPLPSALQTELPAS